MIKTIIEKTIISPLSISLPTIETLPQQWLKSGFLGNQPDDTLGFTARAIQRYCVLD